ncbi:metalloprotease PmbA [Thioalkalivibrio paradoxus]|uniref:Peptidase C69 n=1 Tax=Thioalkalivibrio paradoxus ARh 1 TaxID=713585 RepID=W0DJF9_9GAMM|nr:metalloprotease PmbA [Thioalkalivibrio paradoxus]AHE97377.1 peptidase C69 [Thioalkalivibrio paradoxus ARh 1]
MDRTNEIQALSHTAESLQERVARVLEHARACGASAAQVVVSHNVGLSVTVRRGEVETLEHERDQQMALVAYFGQAKGSASTTDFSPGALRETAEAACRIARHTEPDPWSGLPEADAQARDWPDLELDHPWDCPSDQAIELARSTEAAGFALDPRVDNSEGASVGTRRAMFWLGDSQGFMGGYCSTRHTISCALVARDAGGMQRDYEYTVARDAGDLAEAETVGRVAAERALRRLGARKLATRTCPVLFVPEMARSLIGSFTRAIGGSAQYRRSSFLLDAAGQQVFPDWMQIDERPLLPGALGSAPFDGEGVRTRERALVAGGVLESYILDSYSARRLGLQTTGNAGGARNVTVRPYPGDRGFADLLADMGTGLLVTELIGQGVNQVTGDYSRGAAGFWVENGAIAYPVEEITIAGNLRDMYRRIAAVGNDTDLRGNTRTGSVLIESMTVAGD